MSLDPHPARPPAVCRTNRSWGELAPTREAAQVLRFVLPDRIVAFVIEDIRRWEHLLGEPEQLILSSVREEIVIEGESLLELRIALDLRRLAEVRLNFTGPLRPGPRIRAITIEPA